MPDLSDSFLNRLVEVAGQMIRGGIDPIPELVEEARRTGFKIHEDQHSIQLPSGAQIRFERTESSDGTLIRVDICNVETGRVLRVVRAS